MDTITINSNSVDKDASVIFNYYVALDKVVIWPVTMQGKTVEEVEAGRVA